MKLQSENLPKFECRIVNQKLTQLLDIARNSSFDSFRFHVTEKGFKFNQMDASHVSLIKGSMDLQSFEEYSVKINGKFVVDAAELKDILKVFDKYTENEKLQVEQFKKDLIP